MPSPFLHRPYERVRLRSTAREGHTTGGRVPARPCCGRPLHDYTVPTDHGIQFTDTRPADEEAEARIAAYWAERDEPRIYRWHTFDGACHQLDIEHRSTKPRCRWTNGQVVGMDRTIKDATVKRYRSASHEDLRQHPQLFVDAYNYGRRLETLRGLLPYRSIVQAWTK